jgi:hypothetical protein
MNKISVLSLISFDHSMLLESIATYLDAVDEVILGLDADRTTWAGQKFEVTDSFFSALKSLDNDNKVKIIEERFFEAGAQPVQNFTRVRNALSTKASEDSWLLSIDPDETILNLQEFIDFLRTFTGNNIAIFGKQVLLLKQEGDNVFIVENDDWSKDDIPLATKKRNGYTVNRHTDEPVAFAPVCLINNSWGRPDKDLDLKLHHSPYFAEMGFKQFLEGLNAANYTQFKGFNPFGADIWERVDLVNGDVRIYASEKLNAMRKELAWSAVSLNARVNLFEGKIVGRDANIAELKVQHKAELEKMRSEYEARHAGQIRSYKELKMQLDAELLANKARRER